MLQQSINAVAEFHKAKDINFKQRLKPPSNIKSAAGALGELPWMANYVETAKSASERLLSMFNAAYAHWKHDYESAYAGSKMPVIEEPDYRFLRASLIIEEAAELIQALFEGDEVAALDGSADLIYVVNGTAVTYDLPLSEAFTAVHESNMSKAATGPRLQDKGSSYRPPDLKSILEKHRGYRNACV